MSNCVLAATVTMASSATSSPSISTPMSIGSEQNVNMVPVQNRPSQHSYHIRYNGHSSTLSKALLTLFGESRFIDCTLTTGYSTETIRAHRLILSAYSPYFKRLFSSLPQTQIPIVVISEFSFQTLRTIVDFCYRGQILVSSDKIGEVSKAAQLLGVKGIPDCLDDDQLTYSSGQTFVNAYFADDLPNDLRHLMSPIHEGKDISSPPDSPSSYHSTESIDSTHSYSFAGQPTVVINGITGEFTTFYQQMSPINLKLNKFARENRHELKQKLLNTKRKMNHSNESSNDLIDYRCLKKQSLDSNYTSVLENNNNNININSNKNTSPLRMFTDFSVSMSQKNGNSLLDVEKTETDSLNLIDPSQIETNIKENDSSIDTKELNGDNNNNLQSNEIKNNVVIVNENSSKCLLLKIKSGKVYTGGSDIIPKDQSNEEDLMTSGESRILSDSNKMQEIDLSLKSVRKQATTPPIKKVSKENVEETFDMNKEIAKNFYYYERFQQQNGQQNISNLINNHSDRSVTGKSGSSLISSNDPMPPSIAAAAAAAARIQLMSQVFNNIRSSGDHELDNSNVGSLLETVPLKDSTPCSNASFLSAATARAIAASTFASFQATNATSSDQDQDHYFPKFTGVTDSSSNTSNSTLPVSSLLSAAAAAASGYSFNRNLFMTAAASAANKPLKQCQSINNHNNGTHSGLVFHNGTEKRGRGRPPKYGSLHHTSTTAVSQHSTNEPKEKQLVVSCSPSSSSSSSSPPQSTSPSNSGVPNVPVSQPTNPFPTQVVSSNRSRRGRPPSIPDEHNPIRNSSSGRTDKAHHKCPHCPQIYYGYHAMRDHITSVHLNSGEKYICHLCNKEYTWRITLRKHLKCQHGVHPDQVPIH